MTKLIYVVGTGNGSRSRSGRREKMAATLLNWTARLLVRAVLYVLLVAGALVMLTPFLWMVSTSLKEPAEVFRMPIRLLPSHLEWSNYVQAAQMARLGRLSINSFIVSVSTTFFQIFLGSMAAYALARLSFPGRDALFLLILMTQMIPFQIAIVPLFVIIRHMPLAGGNNILGQGGIGLVNNLGGVIAPGLVNAFGIFLLRQFFLTLPVELEDAARIDGCGELGIYWRIVMPLSLPGIAVLALFAFVDGWNSFLWPLVVLNKESLYTVQLGLSVFRSQYQTEWHLLMAASTLITLPIMVVFMLGQRYLVRGIVMSGLKG
jgi:multiple sugar transport system permease protein